MKSNLERFQMTKLCPFKEKIQRQYLSTNVSLQINRGNLFSSETFDLFTFLSAHRTSGGDAANGLHQVPRLASATNDEENLRPAAFV